MHKSGLYETPPRRQFKDYFCYFPIWLIYQLVHDIPSDRGIANLVPSVLFLALCNTIFRVLLTFSNTRAIRADNKRGGKLLLASDRVNFVIATIIYSYFPPLSLAPRFWEPRVRPQPGSIVFDYRT